MQLQVFTIKIPKTIFFFIFQETVAFFAYMNWDQETPSRRHILIFDVVRTNLGDHFKFSGIFNAPQSGTYVFTWEGYCFVKGYSSFQIVVNANVYIGLHCSAGRGGGFLLQTCFGDCGGKNRSRRCGIHLNTSNWFKWRECRQQHLSSNSICRMVFFLRLHFQHFRIKG